MYHPNKNKFYIINYLKILSNKKIIFYNQLLRMNYLYNKIFYYYIKQVLKFLQKLYKKVLYNYNLLFMNSLIN